MQSFSRYTKYFAVTPLLLWLSAIYLVHDYTPVDQLSDYSVLSKISSGDNIRQVLFVLGAFFSLLTMAGKRIPKSYWSLLLVVMIFLLSTFWSEAPSYTLRRVSKFLCMTLVLLPFAVDLDRFQTALRCVFWFAVVVCAVSLSMYYFDLGVTVMSDEIRLQGVTPHPNALGPLAVIGAILLILFQKHKKLLSLPLFLVLMATLFLTKSRSSFAAFVIFVIGYAWRLKSASRHWLELGGVIVLFVIIISVGFFEVKTFGGRDYTLTGRTLLWQATLEDWMTHPFLGAGFGASAVPVPNSFLTKAQKRLSWVAVHSHQEILQLFNEVGLAFAPIILFVLFFSFPYKSEMGMLIFLPFLIFLMIESPLFEGTVFSLCFFLCYLNKYNLQKDLAVYSHR
jgi:O-antigen ligase